MTEKQFYQTVGSVLYPTRIIIETREIVTQGSTYATDDISILPVDCHDDILGETILKHLKNSTFAKAPPNYKELRKAYLKKAKFRSEPAFRQEARFVTIFRTLDSLEFRPYNNKLSEGRWGSFLGMPSEIFEIPHVDNSIEIGKAMRKAWSKCVFS